MLSVLPRLPVAHIRARSLAKARTAPPLQTQPAWLASLGLSVGQWGEISGTNISSVDPSPLPAGVEGAAAKIIGWTSFALVGNKVYSVANGGHADYSGNEVDALDLGADAPAWAELLAPTASGDVVQNVSHYSDGRPTSRHSYYGVVPDETNNRIMLVGGFGYGSPGGDTGSLDAYLVGSNAYAAADTYADTPVSATGAAVWDNPATGDIYIGANWDIYKWSRSGNSWSTLIDAGSGMFGGEAASAFDTSRSRAFILDYETSTAWTHDADATTRTQRTLTGTEAANILGVPRLGMVYVQSRDSFLVRGAGSGGSVWEVDASTFAVTLFAASGSASVPATSNGPYRKWLYVASLGICVYCPTYTGNAWVLRVE